MKLYKVTITPIAGFATKLKGDTLFGHICWAILYTLGKEKLSSLLSQYDNNPFLIVSDGFTEGYLPKPKMPSSLLKENSEDKKINRKKIWLTLDELLKGEYLKARTDKEANCIDKVEISIHNTLNYKTFHTGDGFDPYGLQEFALSKKDIYFLLDEEQLSLEDFKRAFELFSKMGYGKKTTIGKGRFSYDESKIEEVKIDNTSKAYMALSPFSPNNLEVKDIYYEPFIRFGKLGLDRANKNAFKNPIILADVAGVVIFNTEEKRQYIGKAIRGISQYKDTVHQGYSIVIPIGGVE